MNASEDLVRRRHAVVARGVGQFAGDTTADTASGARLIEVGGRELIDFAGGIGVMNVGHCDPKVVEAIREQAAQLIHACIHVATYEPYVALCEKLVELLPHGGPTKAMLANSGAEAVENAVKIARQATGRQAVIAYNGAFHGRTMMGMTLTSKTTYKQGCGPFAPEVYRLPYPDFFRYGDGLPRDAFIARELTRLEESFLSVVAADQVAAVIIEPVMGEGGFVPAPAEYLRGLREVCDREGIVLICDEVQSGFCRTGRWGSYEHAGIVPDLSTWAKSMGGGLPISAVLGKAAVMDAALPGTLGGTYGGNPVACAASLATIAVMEEQDLNARALALGKRIRRRLEQVQAENPIVADIRGLGAMIGIEFCHDGDPQRRAGDVVKAITAQCREQGVLVLPASSYGNVLRVLSPLVITDADLDLGLDVMAQAIHDCSHQEQASK